MLVAAVLRPEQGEDGQLEVVRLAIQQLLDTVVLPVREAESTVQRLFRDGAQSLILPPPSDVAPVAGDPSSSFLAGACSSSTVRGMRRRDASLLLLLAAIWGSSFLFIKLGVDELAPSVVAFARLLLGALLLLVLLVAQPGKGGLAPLRGKLRPVVVLAALNNALPFWLLGFAETRLDSGLTAVIQASAPICTVLLASRIDASQRVTGARLLGVGIGFVGVIMLVGVQSGGQIVAALAVIGAALCYGGSVLFAGVTVKDIPPLQVSLGQLGVAAIMMAPIALLQAPSSMPPTNTLLAVATLGFLGSGIAYLLYFALIARVGAARTILVTYLVPAFALVYGAVFLDEAVTAVALAGLALVLAGTALATGMARLRPASVAA